MALSFVADLLLVGVILVGFIFMAWYIYKQIEFHAWNLPPGPIGLPLLGYAPFLRRENVHEDIAQLNRKYGKICCITGVGARGVFVSDFDTARELLCHPATLFRPYQVFDFAPGKGGFATMNGKQWVDERRFGMQAMRNIGLGRRQWIDIIQEDVDELVKFISTTKGKPMNIDTPLSKSAMNNMLALVLGRQFQSSLTESDFECFLKANKTFKKHFQNAGIALMFPWLLKCMDKFNIAGSVRNEKVLAEVSDIVREEIRKRLRNEEYDSSTDFIKQYLDEVKKQNPMFENFHFHEERCIGNIALFISTSDTAMSSTHWILYFMAAYPEKQARVQAELDDVMGKDGIISWEDREKLPYSMACLMEMQRWVVVVPIFPPRCASETFEFQGYTIPKGTTIFANGWALNRDPKYWDKPDEYMPERFLQTNKEKPSTIDGYAPFSFGKRKCPGENITLMIVFLYFTIILQKFTVSTPSGDPPSLRLRYCGIFEPVSQPMCFTER